MVCRMHILSVYGGCTAGANSYSSGVVQILISVITFIFCRLFFSHPDIQRCGKLTDLEVTASVTELQRGASRSVSPILVEVKV